MITFFEIEERAQEVYDRMAAIVDELARISKKGGSTEAATELMDEMVALVKKSENIKACLEQQHYLAQKLITARCSGPH